MKFLILAVLLSVMQTTPPVPRQATNESTGTGQKVHSNAGDNKTPSPTPSPAANTGSANESNQGAPDVADKNTDHPITISKLPAVSVEKDWADYLAIASSLLLVIIGCAGVGYAVKTLKAISKQADLMEGQLKEMQAAGGQAAKQIAIAEENIKIIISKERARLRIEVDELVLPKANQFFIISVKYKVRLHGPTDAVILNTIADAVVSDSPEPPKDMALSTLYVPQIISALNSPAEAYQFVTPNPDIEKDIIAIKCKTRFVHFWGLINYRDVFNNDWNTRFRFVWKYMAGVRADDGTGIGRWEKCGPPEDNSET